MQWQDKGWILTTKTFSERALLVDIFTKEHGKVRGMIKAGRTKHLGVGQPGIHGSFTWKARLQEHLGQITFEQTSSTGDGGASSTLNIAYLEGISDTAPLTADWFI